MRPMITTVTPSQSTPTLHLVQSTSTARTSTPTNEQESGTAKSPSHSKHSISQTQGAASDATSRIHDNYLQAGSRLKFFDVSNRYLVSNRSLVSTGSSIATVNTQIAAPAAPPLELDQDDMKRPPPNLSRIRQGRKAPPPPPPPSRKRQDSTPSIDETTEGRSSFIETTEVLPLNH